MIIVPLCGKVKLICWFPLILNAPELPAPIEVQDVNADAIKRISRNIPSF